MSEQKALLIIDMQRGSFTPRTPRLNTEQVVEKINALAGRFRNKQWPVIFIQHDGTREQDFIPNTEAWKLLPSLDVQPQDMIISKTANDAFYQSELSATLTTHRVEELLVTGCATDFCVEATVQSALAKNYQVTVVEDGHTTGERPHLSAQQVITHYNWVWRNLIPTQGSVCVMKHEEIEKYFHQ